jgi:hypothetical protein
VSGYTIHIAQVAYWDKVKNPAGFGSTCPGGADPGLQRLTLLVSSADGHVSQQLDVLVRQP